jgi:hypothetical protein
LSFEAVGFFVSIIKGEVVIMDGVNASLANGFAIARGPHILNCPNKCSDM